MTFPSCQYGRIFHSAIAHGHHVTSDSIRTVLVIRVLRGMRFGPGPQSFYEGVAVPQPRDSRGDARARMCRGSAGCWTRGEAARRAPLALAWLAERPPPHRARQTATG